MKPNSDIQIVYLLGAVGLLIMLIAWVNYTNLTTVKTMDRAKEIGIRKLSGSSKKQIILQFIGESVFLNLVGLLIALLIFQVLQSWVHQWMEVPLSLAQDQRIWLLILGFFVLGTLGSAFYPALVLSSFPMNQIIKGSFSTSGRGNFLRKALVVFQFAICLALISTTFTIDRQLAFMEQKDLGMDISQMLILPNPDVVDSTFTDQVIYFKNLLSDKTGISSVANSSQVPGNAIDFIKGGLRRAGSPVEESNNYYSWLISDNFATTYHWHFLAGRNFSTDYGSEHQHLIINKAAADLLGYRDAEAAIGQEIRGNQMEHPMTVVGVIENFNMRSLKAAYDPMVFLMDNEGTWGYYSVKIEAKEADYTFILSEIENAWNEAFPNNPFDYFFLDDYFNAQYKADKKLGKVLGLFALLTILIACLGLFGLSSMATIQRTKEIGIRKVLGASIQSLLLLLSKEHLYLILIAMAIAIPIANYFVREWLATFAFRISVQWWLFAIPGILLLLVAALSISTQILRATHRNPAESLRYE